MERNKDIKLHNDKYNIDFIVYETGYGITYDFEYLGKKHRAFAPHRIGDENEIVHDNLERILNYLDINEKEKTKEKRYNEIIDKNYILLEINDKSEEYYDKVIFSNEELEKNKEVYVHSGLVEDYFVIRSFIRKNDIETEEEVDLTYNPYFMHIDFEGCILGKNTLYIKNNGENTMFISSQLGKMIIRPNEQVKYIKENLWNEKIHLPMSYGE